MEPWWLIRPSFSLAELVSDGRREIPHAIKPLVAIAVSLSITGERLENSPSIKVLRARWLEFMDHSKMPGHAQEKRVYGFGFIEP